MDQASTGGASLGRAGGGDVSRVSNTERLLLSLALAGGAVFGLAALLIPVPLAALAGYPGNDHYIYRLAGAATLGYAVALGLALRSDEWAPVRLVVLAVLGFNLASLYACGVELAGGNATWAADLVLVAPPACAVSNGA